MVFDDRRDHDVVETQDADDGEVVDSLGRIAADDGDVVADLRVPRTRVLPHVRSRMPSVES